jgi:predicted glycoside hydrolase/deacetylase ChbG (UPF0249 family)
MFHKPLSHIKAHSHIQPTIFPALQGVSAPHSSIQILERGTGFEPATITLEE